MGVLEPTVMVMVELPLPGAGIDCGLKLTLTPEGMPEADKAMELLKPLTMVVVMVVVPWFPCATLSEVGDAEMVNVGAPVTVRVTVTVC